MQNGEFQITPPAETSLVQEAIDAGIDVDAIDSTLEEQSPDARPSWLPERFKSAEELAKSYAELEKKMKAPKAGTVEETEEAEEIEAEAEEVEQTEEDAADKAEAAGIDFEDMRSRFWENGGEDLQPEDYDALKAAGIEEHIVKNYIAGQKAIVAQERSSLLAPIGGETAWNEMSTWAADAMSEKEITALNDAFNGPVEDAKKALATLKAKYEAANGSEPKRKVTGRPAAQAPRGYQSMQQLVDDMKNPLYDRDPAYRAKVDAKLAVSNL